MFELQHSNEMGVRNEVAGLPINSHIVINVLLKIP